MKKIILCFIALFIFTKGFSQSSNPETIVENFFKEYNKNSSKAIDELYATSDWNAQAKDTIDKLKKEVSRYTSVYMGRYRDYELMSKKQLSGSLMIYSYLVKYDRQPLRFVFELYKPDNKWVLLGFKIDDHAAEEVEEAFRRDHPATNH